MRAAAFRLLPFGVAGALLLMACEDTPRLAGPESPNEPKAALQPPGGPGVCGPADVVVDNEDALHDEVENAAPGSTIAIQGTIQLDEQVFVNTEDVTLTCASPGAGLKVGAAYLLLTSVSPNTVVRNLELNAAGKSRTVEASGDADGFVVRDNEITCARESCVFTAGVDEVVVENNTAVSPDSGLSGLHIQAVDGALIAGNTVEAEEESETEVLGGIRVRQGSDVTIRDNHVEGLWQNGLSLAELEGATVAQNSVDGSVQHGIAIHIPGEFTYDEISQGNSVGQNDITDSGDAGILVNETCDSKFQSNQVTGTSPAVSLTEDTGANMVVGTQGQVDDEGEYDCTGDGQDDPNMVPGA